MKYFSNLKFSLQDFIFCFVFVLVNIRATLFVYLYFLETDLTLRSFAWFDMLLWIIVFFLIIKDLLVEKQLDKYLRLLQANKILLLFIAFVGGSAVWSIAISATFFRWLELLLSTLAASYFFIRFPLESFFKKLLQVGVLFILINILFSIFLPSLSSPAGYPYYGAWRGIFWHKNHLGIFVALFNILSLLSTFYSYRIEKSHSFFGGLVYIFTLMVVLLSKSATALLIILLTSTAFFLLQIWLIIRHQLQKTHYYLMGGLFVVIILIGYMNISYLFALIGRDMTLTGRLQLWKYLFEDVITKKPWLGHGFGAFWEISTNRKIISEEIGWDYAVLISDNGFLDIFIHLGMVGLIFFLIIFLRAFLNAFRIAVMDIDNLLSFFPLFFLIYTVLANISFSLFVETELLVWVFLLQIYFYVENRPFKAG